MTLKTLLAAAAVALVTSSPSSAAPIDFNFSFTGGVVDGSPLVTGIVRGLAEGTNSVDTIEITSNSLGYGIGSYTHNASGLGAASWTVTGGMLTDWFFFSGGLNNAPTQVTDSSVLLTSSLFPLLPLPFGGNTFSGFSAITQNDNGVNEGGGTLAVFQQVAAVPLPAGLPLVLTGLAGFGMLRLKRKRAVKA